MVSRLKVSLLSLGALPLIIFAGSAQAADVFQPCETDAGKNSAVCKSKNAQEKGGGRNPLFGPDGVITFIINLISALVGIAAVIMIILAGLKFITSGNNPQDVSSAREMVIYAVAGLIIAVSAQLIVRVFLAQIGD